LSNKFTSFTWCNQEAIDVQLKKDNLANCSSVIDNNKMQIFRKEINKKCKKGDKCHLSFEKVFEEATD